MTRFYLPDPTAMETLGAALAGALRTAGATVYLKGDLGAGKTTFVRGVARGLGVSGRVRSPTYTLVEGYELPDGMLYHLDLYRISGSGELEFLGVRDLEAPANRIFIEWPERVAQGTLPAADLILSLAVEGDGRSLTADAVSERGRQLVEAWQVRAASRMEPGTATTGLDSKLSL